VVQVYKQKVKHLLYEHQQNIAALKIDAQEKLKQAGDEAAKRIQDLVMDKQHLRHELNEQVRTRCPDQILSQQHTHDLTPAEGTQTSPQHRAVTLCRQYV